MKEVIQMSDGIMSEDISEKEQMDNLEYQQAIERKADEESDFIAEAKPVQINKARFGMCVKLVYSDFRNNKRSPVTSRVHFKKAVWKLYNLLDFVEEQ